MKIGNARFRLAWLFFVALSAYGLNRWDLKPLHPENGFLQNYFNDLFLMPCAFPAWCWMCESLGLRGRSRKVRWLEIALLLGFWSLLFEVLGPKILHHGVADFRDVIAYTAGAILTGLIAGSELEMKFIRTRDRARKGDEQADAMLDIAQIDHFDGRVHIPHRE